MILIIAFQTKAINENVPATEPITISGYVKQTGLDNKIPIHLEVKEGHPYAFIYINIYVDDILIIQEEEITKYLPTKIFEIDGFTYRNETKNIRIEVNYLENHVQTSVCNIKFQGPSYDHHKTKYSNSLVATDNNPIQTNFVFKANECIFDSVYEHVAISSSYHKSSNTRFLSFSDLSISLYNIYDELDMCELRIYCKFEESDFLFKNNSYTSIDMQLEKVSDYKYKIKDEYRFYIDDKTGMIYESQTSNCADELYPLFIPLSFGEDVSIEYEIHFSNIGINCSDYIFSGNYHLYSLKKEDDSQYGSVLSYKYTQIFEELTEVQYA